MFVGCFWNFAVAIVAIVLFVALARRPGGAANSRRVLSVGIFLMFAGVAVSGLVAAAVHRYFVPRDDWFDIVGVGSLLTGCFSTPFFGLILLCAFYETQRTRTVRFGHRYCTCGYDLTGNQFGRCPECGQEIPLTRSGRP